MKKITKKPELTPKQKQEEKVKAYKAEVEKQKKLKLEKVKIKTGKYRYSCNGCTKIAFWADKPQSGDTKVCPHCSKINVTTEDRYILDK